MNLMNISLFIVLKKVFIIKNDKFSSLELAFLSAFDDDDVEVCLLLDCDCVLDECCCLLPANAHNNSCKMSGTMVEVHDATKLPEPDESTPEPFESTPIINVNSIKYKMVDGFCMQKRCQFKVLDKATSRTDFKFSTKTIRFEYVGFKLSARL